MEIRYNVTGSERKRLVQTIAQTLEVKAKYLACLLYTSPSPRD